MEIMHADDIQRRGLVFTGRHLPYNRKLTGRAKELRKNMTPAEKKLWYGFLRTFRFRALPQRPIDNYIVDFFCPKLKLAIEIDGESHNEKVEYDKIRQKKLESLGVRFIRFRDEDVKNNLQGCLDFLKEWIDNNTPPG